MEIRLTTALTPVQATQGVASLLERLRPGENIAAVVETRLSEGNYLLRLAEGGQTLRARSQLDLNAGEVLKLEVVKTGPTPELRIVPQKPAEAPDAVAVQQALRQFLPKQQPVGALAPALREILAQQAAKTAPALPEPLRNLMKTVLQALPQKASLMTAEGLRRATADSGLFLEARLAASPEQAGDLGVRDFKGGLLALNQALKSLIQSAAAAPRPAPETPAAPAADARTVVAAPQDNPALGRPLPLTSAPAPTGETTEAADQAASQPPPDLPKPALGSAPSRPTAESGAVPSNETSAGEPDTPVPQAAVAGAENRLAPPAGNPPPMSAAAPGGQPEEQPDTAPTAPEMTSAQPEAAPPTAEENGQAQAKQEQGGGQAKPGDTGKPPPGTEASAEKTATRTTGETPPPAETKTAAQVFPRLLAPEPPKNSPADSTTPDRPVPVDAAAAEMAESATPERRALQPAPEGPAQKDAALRQPAAQPAAAELPDETAGIRTLQQHTEGALARIVLDQLSSLPQGDGKPMVWQMEIPFTDDGRPDSAKFKIVREQSHAAQPGQAFWSVILEVSPPGLGTIHSRITLCGERVDTYFWSDIDATSSLIEGNLDLLAARMQQAGLQVGELNSLPGAPADAGATTAPLASLVDERA